MFLVSFITPSLAFSQDKKEGVTFYYNNLKIEKETKDFIINNIEPILLSEQKKGQSLNVNINIGHEFENYSYTDSNPNKCTININYKEKKPIILNSFYDDLFFIILHEMGHCVIGKEVFFSDDFPWLIEEGKSFNNLINHLTNIAVNNVECIDCLNKKFKVSPPKLVYLETFADLYAIYFMIEKNKSIHIVPLSKYRIDQFYNSPINTPYASFFAVPIFLKSSPHETKIIEEFAQKGLIEYLKYIKNNYNNLLKIEDGEQK